MPASSLSASVASMAPMTAGTPPSTPLRAARCAAQRLAVGIERCVADPAAVVEEAHLPVEGANRAVDPRPPRGGAGVVDEVTRREVIAAVDHQVVGGREPLGVFGREPLGDAVEARRRREGREPAAGHLALGTARLLLGIERLPRQVAPRDHVGVAEAEAPHAGPRKRGGHRRAQTAQTHEQHRRRGQPPLPLLADFGQHDLPRVAFVEHRQSKILSQSFQTTSYPSRRMSASTCAGVRSSLTTNCSSDVG